MQPDQIRSVFHRILCRRTNVSLFDPILMKCNSFMRTMP